LTAAKAVFEHYGFAFSPATFLIGNGLILFVQA